MRLELIICFGSLFCGLLALLYSPLQFDERETLSLRKATPPVSVLDDSSAAVEPVPSIRTKISPISEEAFSTSVVEESDETFFTNVVEESDETPSTSVVDDAGETEPCWTVLWLRPKAWEEFYLDDLLVNVPFCDSESLFYSPGMDLSAPKFRYTILATSIRVEEGNNNRLAMDALDKLSYRYITFLTGDEILPSDTICSAPPGELSRDMLDRSGLVIRNYFAADCQNEEKVITAPLLVAKRAMKHGYPEHCGRVDGPKLHFGKKPSDRTSFLYFSSHHAIPERTEFVQTVLDNLPEEDPLNKFVLKYRRTQTELNTVSDYSYGECLADAKFAGILPGNVPETWRFYESLFCGAIPILEKSVYDYYRPWLPTQLFDLFPTYDGPEELKALLPKLMEEAKTPAKFNDHSMAVREAAQSWLSDVRSNLEDKIRQVAVGK